MTRRLQLHRNSLLLLKTIGMTCVWVGVYHPTHVNWRILVVVLPRVFPPVVSLYSPCLLPVMRDPALQRVNEEQRHLGGAQGCARIDSISFP